MTAWIFQGNPDRFDMDGYLRLAQERAELIRWRVKQHPARVGIGDQVFLWRAHGSGKFGEAGIVAECIVISGAQIMPDEPWSIPFRRPRYNGAPTKQVKLRLVRFGDKGILKKSVIRHIPMLENVGPIGFGNATNYVLEQSQPEALNRLWNGTNDTPFVGTINEKLNLEASALEQYSLQSLLDKYGKAHKDKLHSPCRIQSLIFD